jgi:hypothetical protein
MIASASVMATLDMLKHAAAVFNWSLDIATTDQLIATVTEINEVAALEQMGA